MNGPSNLDLLLSNDLNLITNFDFLFLSETWLTSFQNTSLFDYNCICIPATKTKAMGRYKGGIICFYKKCYEVFQILSDEFSLFFSVKPLELVLGVIYLPPNSTEALFAQIQKSIYDITCDFSCPVYVGGDMNSRIGLDNQSTEEYFEGTLLSNMRDSVEWTEYAIQPGDAS